MRWMGYVANMEKRRVYAGFWWRAQLEREQLEDLGVGERIVLKWTGLLWLTIGAGCGLLLMQ